MIFDWSHKSSIPVKDCASVFKSVVDVEECFSICSRAVQVLHKQLFLYEIKGGFCVQVKDEDGLLEVMNRVLEAFGEEERSEIVGAARSLKLTI